MQMLSRGVERGAEGVECVRAWLRRDRGAATRAVGMSDERRASEIVIRVLWLAVCGVEDVEWFRDVMFREGSGVYRNRV